MSLYAKDDRRELAARIDRNLGPFDPLHLEAIVRVPREVFVHPEDAAKSSDDTPLWLDDVGLATISAPHAYLLSFRVLALGPGDRLLELGSGSGYGAALAAFIVGPAGSVTTLEIDGTLAARARGLLGSFPTVLPLHGDAVTATNLFQSATKISCAFAVERIPEGWLGALPEGAAVVVPVGPPERDQRLLRARRTRGEIVVTDHGPVRYVPNRSAEPA